MDYSKEIKELNKIIRNKILQLIFYSLLLISFIAFVIIFVITRDTFYGIISILFFLIIETGEKKIAKEIRKDKNDMANIVNKIHIDQ